MAADNLYDMWAKRNPKFETRFEENLLRLFTDYGVGSSDAMTSRGKVLGAGYELYIYAFFVGLYAGKKQQLSEETKVLGQPIQYWGNLDSKKFRKAYPRLREYVFIALVAKTGDIDWIAVEDGTVPASQAVDMLKNTMEQYANYGFHAIEEKLKDNPNCFFKSTGFLDLILELTGVTPIEPDDEIEEL